MPTPGPVTTGRWISQSSARVLGLLRRGELAEEAGRSLGTVSRGDLDATIRQLNALTRGGDLPAGDHLRTVT